MLVNFQREYNISKMLLSGTGLWPYQSELIRYLILIWCVANYILLMVFEILMLYDYWEDMDVVFNGCYQIVVLISITAKQLNMFFKREQIKRICEAIENHWNVFTNKSEIQILKNYSVITRKLTTAFLIYLYIATIIFVLAPLTPVFLDMIHPLNESRSRLYPVTIKFRIDHEKYYTQFYCFLAVTIIILIIVTSAIDDFFLVSTIHACSLFSIISRQFEEITTKLHINKDIKKIECCIKTKSEFENERMTYQEYIICLKKYQLALEFVDILNSMYKIISLILLILYGAIATFIGTQIVNVLDQLDGAIRYISVVVGDLVQLMISCYAGQRLRDESQNIFYQAYAAEWYKYSPRLKSLLIITLYRSAVPCGLTAGNVIPLSLETYGFVVRTAGSYFMTFLSLKK